MKAESAITIRKPPAEVFQYLKYAEKISQWTPVKGMRLLTEGPIGVGTQYAQTISVLGQNFESVTEIMEFDEPNLFVFKAISGPLPFLQRFTLSPTGDGTKLEAVLEGEPGGFFKLAQSLLAPAAHKQLHDQLHKLKHLLEG
jgi:uncharacterized protein YndB with AHSA1/START domain